MVDRVVIVGGGYGGIKLASTLDAELDVLLIDPKDSFVHSVAALRGLVDEAWGPRIFYPYERLLDRGQFVRDRVVAADPTGVTMATGARIDADYLVLASGSSYPYPAKMDLDTSAHALAKLTSTRSQLAAASRVLLVGAGPVGIELAGEITSTWPDKQVTIVDLADDILAGQHSDELRTSLRHQLAERGVRLLLGSPLTNMPGVPAGTSGVVLVETQIGERIEADIWFRCHGLAPTTGYLRGGLARARRPNGFLTVDRHLCVAGQSTVFAIGDITAIDEPKRGGVAGRHARVVAENIRALVRGDQPDAVYRPGSTALLMPLGRTGGAGELRGPDRSVLLGPREIARRKGEDLLVHRYTQMFHFDRAAERPHPRR